MAQAFYGARSILVVKSMARTPMDALLGSEFLKPSGCQNPIFD